MALSPTGAPSEVSPPAPGAGKKGRQVGAKTNTILSFDKELERFEFSYYERHLKKGYPEQVTAGTQLARQMMVATRKAAARAAPDTPWQTRANVLVFMCGVMDLVCGGNGMPMGSAVRQEFFTMSQEFVRLFRDIIGNMTDTEKQMLRTWRPPARRKKPAALPAAADGGGGGGHGSSGNASSNASAGGATGGALDRPFDDNLDALAALADEVDLFYDLDKCLELLRGGHPLFLRCEESWCVSNILKKQKIA
jgi:hypothetical protein